MHVHLNITAQSKICKLQQCESIQSRFSMPKMGNGEKNYVGTLYRSFKGWKGISHHIHTKCPATAFSRYLSHNHIYPKRKLLSYDHYVTPAGTPSCKFKNRNCEIKLLVCGHMGLWVTGKILSMCSPTTQPGSLLQFSLPHRGRVLISRLVTKLRKKVWLVLSNPRQNSNPQSSPSSHWGPQVGLNSIHISPFQIQIRWFR